MSLYTEFKAFIRRGNVVDLAVGVIMGGAFGKIVNSLVADVLMPPIGYIVGGKKFTDIKITLPEDRHSRPFKGRFAGYARTGDGEYWHLLAVDVRFHDYFNLCLRNHQNDECDEESRNRSACRTHTDRKTARRDS